jgi:hypothetical protein
MLATRPDGGFSLAGGVEGPARRAVVARGVVGATAAERAFEPPMMASFHSQTFPLWSKVPYGLTEPV